MSYKLSGKVQCSLLQNLSYYLLEIVAQEHTFLKTV